MPVNKNVHAVLLTSSNLSFLDDKKAEPLTFPETSVTKLEVLDDRQMVDLIAGFVAKVETKTKVATLLLSPDILFQQSLPLTDLEDVKKQADNFFKEIPLPQECISKKTLTNDKEVYLLAANRDLYSFVKEGFEKAGWTIDAILPVSLFFGFAKDKEITKKDIETIYENEQLFQSANFLTDSLDSLGDENDAPRKSHKKLFIAVGIILVLILLGLFAVKPITSGIFAKPEPTPTKAPAPTDTPTPTVAPKDKGTLTVKVLNGTGTVGDASKVKNTLIDLKYTASNITTDNAGSQDSTTTTVVFAQDVSKTDQDELVKELKKTFTDVSSKEATGTPDTDIVITTGK